MIMEKKLMHESELKAILKERNKQITILNPGSINPYNYNSKFGITQNNRQVKRTQKVKAVAKEAYHEDGEIKYRTLKDSDGNVILTNKTITVKHY